MKYLTLLLAGLLVACTAAQAGQFAITNEATNTELGYAVSLYDEVRDCADSYYAEKHVGDVSTPGCWIALDDGAGGVYITALYSDAEGQQTFEVYVPDNFEVLHDPQWEGGPYADEAEEAPAE